MFSLRALALGLVLLALLVPGRAFAAEPVIDGGTITDGGVRFQVISPTLIRLEHSSGGSFEDRPTMLGFDRSAPRGPVSVSVEGGRLVLHTGRISLSYRRGSGAFNGDNLRIAVRIGERSVTAAPSWRPASYSPPLSGFTAIGYLGERPDRGGVRTQGNLGGWTRGLDSQRGPTVLHDGLLSREGWSFIDDSRSVVLLDGGKRFEPRQRRDGAYQDGYLFGYGHDYARALADYRRLSGPAPLLPRKAFGVWFSRYFPFTESDYRGRLLPAFRRERVPLDVLVVDTEFRAPQAWDGWNWNKRLFPDPPRFLRWAHREGLEVTFNAHPSIALSDPKFSQANRAAGGLIGPAVGPAVSGALADPRALVDAYFTFDLANPRHLSSYFALHEPFERDGADFWWLDWCCEEARVGRLIPDGTISGDAWINMQYARRSAARGTRWLNLSRIGGSFEDWAGDRPGPWGEQRSAIHFTGDAYSTWPMLDFQTRFNVAEGNTGLPYVSHDIAGFQGSELTPELYVRWVQAATFAPILRLHSSKNGVVERLPWEFTGPARAISAEFLRLRGALVPYLYTLARKAYDTGVPLTRAMYLRWPEHDAAYEFDRQFMLGRELLVAPVGSPGNPATKKVWFPPGTWVDWFTGRRYRGPAIRDLRVPLERMPVFARAGAIVPLAPYTDHSDKRPLRRLRLRVFGGRSGDFSLYEDAGEGFGYQRGRRSRTPIRYRRKRRALRIGPARGRFRGRVRRRSYRVLLVGLRRVRRVRVNGRRLRRRRNGVSGWQYRRRDRTLVVRVRASTSKRIVIRYR